MPACSSSQSLSLLEDDEEEEDEELLLSSQEDSLEELHSATTSLSFCLLDSSCWSAGGAMFAAAVA
jgi:hypothetical protein